MDPLDELIGDNPKIVALRQTVRALVQHHDAALRLPPILITGETGTGKGFLARLMQRAGPRANGPFVDINCAAIPEALLEAELFGYERGAFTDARQSKPGLFQVAHGGTLFLDEVGLLPLGLQAKLLTAIEQDSVRRLGATKSERVNVSIIAATNTPLRAAVRERSFREDLYHRLAVLILELPPLRERPEDIERLAEPLLARICADYNLPPRKLTQDARRALMMYAWPGNIRQLSNVLERAILLCDSDLLTADALDLGRPGSERGGGGETPPSSEHTADNNRQRLVEALERTRWNISRTATALNVTRNTVRARMRLYGLRPPSAAGLKGAPPSLPTAPMMPAGPEHAAGSTVADMRWERRRLTFLRARLIAPDDASPSVTTPVLRAIIEKIETFGGYVNEIGQNGLGAIFGHEPAEDAPRRAATAALAVTTLLAREQPGAYARPRVTAALAIHVDRLSLARIHGRPVVDAAAGHRATTALDDLEPIGAGEIGVSASAVGFLLHHFDVKPAGPGSHRLVGRWVVPGGPHAVSFIGRRHEIDVLHELLDRAMLGRGQIVTIVGEPGIGKSRLLHEFQQSVRPGIVRLEGRCASYTRHVPYAPVIEILKTAWEIEDTDTPEIVDTKVRAALGPLGDVVVASAPYLQYLLFPRKTAELSTLSPDAIKAGTFEAIRTSLLAQQEQRPVVLAIEDLHWIDETSADLLASLAQLTTSTRLLLVATSRPVYQPPWQTRSNATQIAIGPLSISDSRTLVKSVLVTRSVDESVVAHILDRGDGNPLFLEELARSVGEQPGEAAALAVPGTVHDIIAARVEGLAEADRHVLDIAAVIGREVPGPLLEAACERSPENVHDSLRRLHAGEFLYATRFGVDSAYTFKHALTHEVAYDCISAETRPRLHARVLAAIEKVAPKTAERRPETLAYHCTEAGRHGEAIQHWYRAGQLAIQRSAHGDALVHIGEALRLLDGQPESPARDTQEVAMQLAMAMSLTAARGYGAPEVERTLARIRVLADRLTDVTQKFFVHWSAWRFHFSRANFLAAEELVGQLLTIAADHDDRVVRVGAHLAAGVDKFYLGEFVPAREHLAQALTVYDRSHTASQTARYGQDMGVAACGFLGWADAVVGDLESAARRAETTVQLAREIRHPFTLALALFLACEIGELLEDAAMVKTLGEELVAMSREHAFAFFVAIGMTHTGWAIGRMGDVSGGAATMQEGADLFLAVGQRVGLAHRARLADGLLAAGAIDRALDVVADAMVRQRETGEHAFVATLLSVRGAALAKRGEMERARESLQEAMTLANRQGAVLFVRHAAAALRRLEDAR